MMNFRPDLVISLGPNCRNAFNLRRFVGDETAYPFDWWITPVRSMLAMIRPEFRFEIVRQDLSIEQDGGTVLNRRLNLLHHHDFPRNRANGKRVEALEEVIINEINEKYRALFSRMHAKVGAASRPLFVLNGLKANLDGGLGRKILNPALNEPCADEEVIMAVQEAFGAKAYILIIEAAGATETRRYQHGLRLNLADDGSNEELPPGFGWAQPTGVFRRAYQAIGLHLADQASGSAVEASASLGNTQSGRQAAPDRAAIPAGT